MPGYARRSDKNQAAVANAMRGLGASVESLHRVGRGVPDLLVGFRGRTGVVEVKNLEGRGETYTEDQEEWRRLWKGSPPITCTRVEQIPAILKAIFDGEGYP